MTAAQRRGFERRMHSLVAAGVRPNKSGTTKERELSLLVAVLMAGRRRQEAQRAAAAYHPSEVLYNALLLPSRSLEGRGRL